MSCGVGQRCGLDLALLWLWCRPAAVPSVQPLAWELPYALGVALKSKKKKKKKKVKDESWLVRAFLNFIFKKEIIIPPSQGWDAYKMRWHIYNSEFRVWWIKCPQRVIVVTVKLCGLFAGPGVRGLTSKYCLVPLQHGCFVPGCASFREKRAVLNSLYFLVGVVDFLAWCLKIRPFWWR